MIKLIKNFSGLIIMFTVIMFFQKCTSPGDHPVNNIGPAVHEVIIKDMKFNPAETYIARGDKVVFINKDLVTHDVTEAVNRSWTSKPFVSDSTWSRVFDESADYMCTIHPVMKGKIIVQ